MKSKTRFSKNQLPHLAFMLSTAAAMGGTEMTPAPAPAATSDWLKVSGYAAAAYTYTDVDDGPNSHTFVDGGPELDVVKVGFTATQGPVALYASLFYTPGFTAVGDTEAGILDAYLSYKVGDFTITGGKYLSWMGYEAFDTVNMTQLTYANSGVGAVPAYHSGIKVDYATDTFGAGFNVSDSIRGGNGFWTGDEDLGNGLGYEGYVVYKGIQKLTLWAGFAFDQTDGLPDYSTYDVWASYDLSPKLTIAGEVAYNNNSGSTSGVQGLAFLKYAFTDKFSTVFRFGFDDVEAGAGSNPDQYKYTISPTYVFNEHFLMRAEVSYIDSDVTDSLFSGVQALLKF